MRRWVIQAAGGCLVDVDPVPDHLRLTTSVGVSLSLCYYVIHPSPLLPAVTSASPAYRRLFPPPQRPAQPARRLLTDPLSLPALSRLSPPLPPALSFKLFSTAGLFTSLSHLSSFPPSSRRVSFPLDKSVSEFFIRPLKISRCVNQGVG